MNNRIKVIYYKCTCGCRVGIPIEYGFKDVDEYHPCSIIGTPNNWMEKFYCNHCKKETVHMYCGYRNVEK